MKFLVGIPCWSVAFVGEETMGCTQDPVFLDQGCSTLQPPLSCEHNGNNYWKLKFEEDFDFNINNSHSYHVKTCIPQLSTAICQVWKRDRRPCVGLCVRAHSHHKPRIYHSLQWAIMSIALFCWPQNHTFSRSLNWLEAHFGGSRQGNILGPLKPPPEEADYFPAQAHPCFVQGNSALWLGRLRHNIRKSQQKVETASDHTAISFGETYPEFYFVENCVRRRRRKQTWQVGYFQVFRLP